MPFLRGHEVYVGGEEAPGNAWTWGQAGQGETETKACATLRMFLRTEKQFIMEMAPLGRTSIAEVIGSLCLAARPEKSFPVDFSREL